MDRTIFISLPVADVAASVAFYQAMGLVKDDALSSGSEGAMMRWSGDVCLGLLSRARFAAMAPRPVADSASSSAVLFAFSCSSREAVDAVVARALAAGAREGHTPEDLGFMYSRAFEDLDGHAFGPMWMDEGMAPTAASDHDA